MIINKEKYDNCKAQVIRQKAEISITHQQMGDLKVLVSNLEDEVNALKNIYKPEKKEV